MEPTPIDKKGKTDSKQKSWFLRFAIVMAVAPLIPWGLQLLFEIVGCTGGFSTLGPQIPDCRLVGIDFGAIFTAAGTLAFLSVILIPITLLWIAAWLIAFYFAKAKMK